MVRFLALAVLGFLIFLVLRATMASVLAALSSSGGARRPALRDELVKDPVCATYIPRRKAIVRGAGDSIRYFCSAACADKFASRRS